MANTFGTHILIQVRNPKQAAAFYVDHLGFTVSSEKPVIELRSPHINLYIEEGPPVGCSR